MASIGIAGLGTVGSATVTLLQNRVKDLNLTLKCVSARDRNKDRPVDLSAYEWCDNPIDMVDTCDIIVELMGGTHDAVQSLAEQALENNKKLVTANKALLARNTGWLTHPNLYFEAAVGGGIPMIRTVRDYLRSNKITAIQGILNGTCNYILSEMKEKGLDFDTALQQAQDLGYAEADPTADIDGHDTAQKLIILSALAFGHSISESDLPTEGIRGLSNSGNTKLVARAEIGNDGKLNATVVPTDMTNTALEGVNGVTNALLIDADPIGSLLLSGPGAGGGATASAVMADIIDAAAATA